MKMMGVRYKKKKFKRKIPKKRCLRLHHTYRMNDNEYELNNIM